jgi:hypothetical protein
VIPAFEPDGRLPRGRFCTTPDEVQDVLVKGEPFTSSTTRDQVWADFLSIIELIRRKKVKVPAAFVGGSFVTSAVDPGDVDAAIFIDTSRITNPTTLTAVRQIVDDPKGQGLQVDSFLILWSPDGSHGGRESSYLSERGKWDDFWQRSVVKKDRSPAQRSHAMPMRGYLEVVLDGYV